MFIRTDPVPEDVSTGGSAFPEAPQERKAETESRHGGLCACYFCCPHIPLSRLCAHMCQTTWAPVLLYVAFSLLKHKHQAFPCASHIKRELCLPFTSAPSHPCSFSCQVIACLPALQPALHPLFPTSLVPQSGQTCSVYRVLDLLFTPLLQAPILTGFLLET